MKTILFTLILLITCGAGFSQTAPGAKKEKTSDTLVVEASCGQCQFGMDGKGCDLAVKIDGKGYYVDGTDIHKHGDAHGKDGFCNAIRKAKVTGEIKNGRYHAKSFLLLPMQEKTK